MHLKNSAMIKLTWITENVEQTEPFSMMLDKSFTTFNEMRVKHENSVNAQCVQVNKQRLPSLVVVPPHYFFRMEWKNEALSNTAKAILWVWRNCSDVEQPRIPLLFSLKLARLLFSTWTFYSNVPEKVLSF